MAIPTPPAPLTFGAIEAAGISFLGAFVGALAIVGSSLVGSVEVGVIAAAATLGYHAYQAS